MSGFFLHIGDLVSLQYLVDGKPGEAAQGVLATQGMPSTDVYVQLTGKDEPHPPRAVMAESVFLVRQQHSYVVARQLQNKLDKSGLSLAEANDRPEFRNVLREREREKLQNMDEFKAARGREVRYGMVIQLQHSLTQRYLKVSRLATTDKEGRKVVVDREAAEGGWFRVHPRLRVHTEGERVRIGDPIVLQSVETGLKLHIDGFGCAGSRVEVAGTRDGSTLKIVQYRSHKDERLKELLLLAGQPVRISHKESDSSLRGDSLGDSVSNCKAAHGPQPSQTIWELGKADRTTGRPIHDGNVAMWDRTYVLHHVATSRFLGTRPRNPYEGMPLSSGAMEEAVTEDSAATLAGAEAVPAGTALAPKAQRNAIPSIRVPVLKSEPSADTLWELVPLYSSGEEAISLNKFFFLRHVATGMWLHNELTEEESRRISVDALSRHEDALLPCLVSPAKRDEDIFGVQLTNDEHYKDLLFVRTMVNAFRQFEGQFVGAPPRPRESIDFEPIIKATGELIRFVSIADDPDPFTRDGLPHVRRQQLLREQLLLDLAFEAGQMPLSDTPWTTWRVLTRCTREAAPFIIDEHLAPKAARSQGNNANLHQMMLITVRLAQFILRGDAANRAHVMKMGYVPLWQVQLGYALKIAPALAEVFNENETLLDKVADDTILTYVDLLRTAGREARYVDFLIVLCSAKGKAVRANQDRICRFLLQQAPELLVTLHQRPVRVAQTPSNKGIEVYVKGDGRYFKGLESEPTLAAWLESQDLERRTFFERCLTLFGRLVLDRNQANTPLLQDLLPMRLLQALVNDTELNARYLGVCAQAMALLRVLYVNNTPHEPLAYLQTVRMWGGITAQSAGTLTSRHTVGLDIDWTHFNGLKRYIEATIGKAHPQNASRVRENRMVLEAIQTLCWLVEAGFYDLDELQAMRVPLLLLLDGRDDTLGRKGYHEEPTDRYEVMRTKDCDTMLLMECKLWICKLWRLVFTVRLDMRLSRFLYLYRAEWEAGFHSKRDEHDTEDAPFCVADKASFAPVRVRGRSNTPLEKQASYGETRLNQLRLLRFGKENRKSQRPRGASRPSRQRGTSRATDVEMLLPSTPTAPKSTKGALTPRGGHSRLRQPSREPHWLGGGSKETRLLMRGRREACDGAFELLKLEGDDLFDGSLARPEEKRPTFRLVLMDLLSYKSPELVDAAISLLVSHFEQRVSLQSSLTDVQVLVKPAMCRVFGDFDVLLRQLSTLASRRSLFANEMYDAAHVMSTLLTCLYNPDLEQLPTNAKKETLLTKRELLGDHTLGLYLQLLGTAVVQPGLAVVTVQPHRAAKRTSRLSAAGRARQPTDVDGAADKEGGGGGVIDCAEGGETVWLLDEPYVVREARGMQLVLDRPIVDWRAASDAAGGATGDVADGRGTDGVAGTVAAAEGGGAAAAVRVAWIHVQRDSPAVDKDVQRLLRNMAAHKLVLQLLRLPFAHGRKREDRAERELRLMLLMAYRLLKAMVLEFSQLQQELASHMGLFLSHLDADLKARDISPVGLIAAVCHDNRVACLQISDNVIDRFVEMAGQELAPQHLRFLRMLIDPQGRVIRRNQEACVAKLAESTTALLLYNGAAGRAERKALIDADDAARNPRGRLAYHLQLLLLLASATNGRSAVVELTVRDAVPLDEVMAHLLDESLAAALPLRSAYLRLLDEAFITTELFQKDLGSHQQLPALLRALAQQVDAYAEERLSVASPLDELDASHATALHDAHIFEVLVPAVQHLFDERHYREQCAAETHAASRKLLASLLGLLRRADGRGLPTHKLTACIAAMAGRMSSVAPDGPSALPHDWEGLQVAAAAELDALEKNVALRRTIAQPSPQDGLAHFTAEMGALMRVDEEAGQLVAVFMSGIDDEVARGEPEPLGVQYCRQVINQLQQNRVQLGEAIRDEPRRQAIAVVRVLTAVATVEGDDEKADSLRSRRQSLLDGLGATQVAVMMATCLDDALYQMGLRLGIALLQGGHDGVQRTLHRLLTDPKEADLVRPFDGSSGRFLAMAKYRLEVGIKELCERKFFYEERAERLRSFEADTANLSPATVVAMRAELEAGFASRAAVIDLLTLLQLTCEGHNQQMQDYLRDQPQEVTDIDLVTEAFHFLAAAETEVDSDNVDQLQQCLVTLVELVQGNVSRGNSQTLVGCKCIELLGRLIQSDVLEGLSSDMRDEVRASVANLLSAMLEGNNDAVKERMKTVLDLKGMLKLCNSYYASAQSLKQQLLPDGLPLATTKDLFVLQADNDGMSRRERAAMRAARRQMQLDTGFALFLLVLDLADDDAEGGGDGLDDPERGLSEMLDEEALRYYRTYTAHVEIVNSQGQLERVLFPFPPFCLKLTEESKKALLEQVDRDTPGRIVFDFFERTDELHAEMKHLATLEDLWLWRLLLHFKPYAVRSIFAAACVINVLVIAYDVLERSAELLEPDGCSVYGSNFNGTHKCGFIDEEWRVLHGTLQATILVLGVLQCLSAVTVFLLYAMQSGPVRQDVLWRAASGLTFAEAWARASDPLQGSMLSRTHFVVVSGYYLLHDPKLLFFLVEFLATLLALTISPYFYAMLLLDIVLRDADLQNVFKAVTAHGRSILVTAFFGIIVIYFFAIVGMVALNQDAHPSLTILDGDPVPGYDAPVLEYDYCNNLLVCLVTATSEGLRGGDIGAMMSKRLVSDPYFWVQMLYTFLYWTIMITILLNVIFGIIIDTFSELRTDTLRMMQDMQNSCFICRIDRFTLDTKGNGFERHIKRDHNMWNYLNMIVHVREKDEMEHNGWEGYIHAMMQQKDLSFFPRNQAISLAKMKAREQAETLHNQKIMAKTAKDVSEVLAQQGLILKELSEMREAQSRLEARIDERTASTSGRSSVPP